MYFSTDPALQKYEQCPCNILYPHHLEYDAQQDCMRSPTPPAINLDLPTKTRLIINAPRIAGSDVIGWLDLPVPSSDFDFFIGIEIDPSIKNVFYRFSDSSGQPVEIEACAFHGSWRIAKTPIPVPANLQVKIVTGNFTMNAVVAWYMNVPDTEQSSEKVA